MDVELPAGENSIGIGADRVKGHVPEVEQSRITDHHVEPDGEEHVDEHHVDHAHVIGRQVRHP